MDITVIADIATVLSLPVSIIAIIVSIRTKQELDRIKTRSNINVKGVTGDINIVSGNVITP